MQNQKDPYGREGRGPPNEYPPPFPPPPAMYGSVLRPDSAPSRYPPPPRHHMYNTGYGHSVPEHNPDMHTGQPPGGQRHGAPSGEPAYQGPSLHSQAEHGHRPYTHSHRPAFPEHASPRLGYGSHDRDLNRPPPPQPYIPPHPHGVQQPPFIHPSQTHRFKHGDSAMGGQTQNSRHSNSAMGGQTHHFRHDDSDMGGQTHRFTHGTSIMGGQTHHSTHNDSAMGGQTHRFTHSASAMGGLDGEHKAHSGCPPDGTMFYDSVHRHDLDDSRHWDVSFSKSDTSLTKTIYTENDLKQTADTSADQEWVNTWLAKNKINHRLKERKQKTKSIAIPTARHILREVLSVTEDLQHAQSGLQDNLHSETQTWQAMCEKVSVLKERLSEIRSTLSDTAIERLASETSQIRTKRLRLKTKRKKQYKEKVKKLKRREELHQKVDEWRARILKKDETKKREKELKAAADETLAEVRRKLMEAQRSHDLLSALAKLRQLRKDAADRKGVTVSRELDTDFEERSDELRVMLAEQLKVYEAEKKTLEAMLEMEAEVNREKELEEKKRKLEELERRKERSIRIILFGREVELPENDPMLPFQQYYLQSTLSLESLIQIRREWDLFLVPPSTGGSRLPDGWVMPSEPTSDAWTSVLKDRLTLP